MKLRVAAVIAGSLTVAAALLLGWLWFAARHVPSFYQQALHVPPPQLQEESDRLLENAAALASNVHREGRWQALFTADEINGWLAVDLPKNFPELQPQGIAEPRVAIQPKCVSLACRYQDGPVEAVLSLDGEVYMQEPNVLSVRIHKARAGSLPLPLAKVLELISQAAAEANLPLNWLQAGGDPVAVIHLHPPHDEQENAYQLETIELREGELYVAGTTTREGSSSPSQKTAEPLASTFEGEGEAKKR